ncbi:MAG: nucleotide exchange factor GrpE [Myxococcales bacterium]|nr:nucleotide exchange factor GrpE [Myxococcales bacterium]
MAEQDNEDEGAPPSAEAPAAEKAGNAAGTMTEVKPDLPVETVDGRIARLEKDKSDSHERVLRIAAEFENFKKRSRREADESSSRGREMLARDLLPVLDNLERALQALDAGGTVESLGQGVKLVDKQLHGVLDKFEIRGFDALGEAFDPAKHEAIQQVETVDYLPGAVARVFARGYLIGSRLLRPAMVAVAKAPAALAEPLEVEVEETVADPEGGTA